MAAACQLLVARTLGNGLEYFGLWNVVTIARMNSLAVNSYSCRDLATTVLLKDIFSSIILSSIIL